jgi:hypothetical protein
VIVRADLPRGVQLANAVHAAGESAQGPIPRGTIAVALAADDDFHLRRLADRLAARGIAHRLIVEADGDYAGQAMAIGITPTTDRAAVGKVVSSLRLVR